jgi:hypothetical protein
MAPKPTTHEKRAVKIVWIGTTIFFVGLFIVRGLMVWDVLGMKCCLLGLHPLNQFLDPIK